MASSSLPTEIATHHDSAVNSFTTIDGKKYAYDYKPAQQSKPTFLFLHGYPSSRKDWEHQVTTVTAAGFGAIAPDMLGFGSSDLPTAPEDYKGKRLANHIAELLDSKGLAKVIGVGHDWGSAVLSRVAMYHQDRFQKLVFLNVGYQSAGFFDIDAINALGLAQWGYMPFGYWYFFDRYDAGSVIKNHLDSFFNLIFPENYDTWKTSFVPVGAARAWLNADTRTEDAPFVTETFKANWKAFLSRPGATESGLNCYRSQLRGVNASDDAKLTVEDQQLHVPVLAILGALDPIARPELMIQLTKPWALGGFESKILDGGHWLAHELPEQLRCTGSRACCDKCKAHGVLCIIPPAPRTKKAAARTVARERRVAEEHAGEIVGSRESHPVSNLESVGLSLSGSFQSLPTPDKDTSPPAPTLQDWGIDIGAFGKDLVTIDSHDFMGFDNPKTYDLVPQDVPEWSNPPPPPGSVCPCLNDLVGIVQKLDDDEYKLRTLAFDQVLKLQKFLLFHCLAPLDCKSCNSLAKAHTVVLIICERVTEMFLCLGRRVANTRPHLVEGDKLEANPCYPIDTVNGPAFFSFKKKMMVPDSPGNSSHTLEGDVGRDGVVVVCNPEMFSPDFREQYSTEEQFHMIRVLAKIQMKNFNQLLMRIGKMPQSTRSEARMDKIHALTNRLEEATAVMEEGFDAIMESMDAL
ncbi:unnamed protein product [Clonostachys rosea f. rosea IK726]|uniref:Uncharacterized protein n=1 Tax=Clonostachys rosea f. rosea IK726 TaxID=1349383 RepID=A0ACA9TG40_BIOOC|nr:unnamed protein product [Clonostachys rosea f. rosea IK726]